MASAKPDLNDVKYDAFLANDRTLGDPDVVKIKSGGRVLLPIGSARQIGPTSPIYCLSWALASAAPLRLVSVLPSPAAIRAE
jgi:hypothetical protein